MVILHDLGVIVLRRLRSIVCHDKAIERREMALAHLYTIDDDHSHESHMTSAY